jgi:FO synthase
MNESISRAAGAAHGQELTVDNIVATAALAGRPVRQRSTLYHLLDAPEVELA